MISYLIRRLLLVIPTLVGIMVINFAIIQAAPGGPVEQMIAKIRGADVDPTARISGGGMEVDIWNRHRHHKISTREINS